MPTSAADLLNIVNSPQAQPAAPMAASPSAPSGTDANTLLAITNGQVPAAPTPAGASANPARDRYVANYMAIADDEPGFVREMNQGSHNITNSLMKGGAALLNKTGAISDETKNNFNDNIDAATRAYNAKYGDTSALRFIGEAATMPPVGNIFKASEEALPFIKQAANAAVQSGAFGAASSAGHPDESPVDQTVRATLAGPLAVPAAKVLGGIANYAGGKIADVADYAAAKFAPKAEQAAAPAMTAPASAPLAPAVEEAAQTLKTNPADIKPEVQQAIAQPTPQTANLTPDQRMRKAEIESLGIPPRTGAITGNAQQQIEERENAKLTGQGEPLRQQFLHENAGLVKAGNQFVSGLGGTAGSDPIVKGQAITSAFQGLEQHYDQEVGKIYDAARAQTGDAKVVDLAPIQQYLNQNKSLFLSSTEGSALLRGLNSQIKQFNGPLSINDAEGFRQFLNSVSSPQNYKLVKGAKAALDDTVAKSGGAKIFDAARALRADQAKTLENPAPIAKILDSNQGNRAISDEKIPDYLATLPLNQLNKVKSTLLTKMPTPELQRAGQQAWNELRTHMGENIVNGAQPGNTINELGDRSWSAPAFTKNLNKYTKTKLSEVFTPAEMQQIGTMQRVGNYVAPPVGTNTSNTASQLANFLQSGAVSHIPVVGGFSKGVGQDLEKAALNKKITASVAGNVTPAAEQAATQQSQQRVNNIAQSPLSAQAAAAYANFLRYKKEDK